MSTLWTTVPLDKNANSIRIFTIDSDDGGDNLRCSFRTVQLSDEPLYTAISYTWHTPLGPRERSSENEPFVELGSFIICNGFQVQILDNLYWALRQLRTSSLPGVEFWADALCIDQSNVPERNHQVAAMAEIFQSAQNVVVWLGPSTSSVSRAVEFVELMSGLTAEAMQAFAYRTPCDDLDGHTRSKLMQRDYWESLEMFFSRSWFIRAWIVQETLLARQLNVMCGAQTVAWDKLRLVSVYLLRFAHNLAPLHPGCFEDSVYFDIPARLDAGRNNQFAKGMDGLLYSLVRSRKHMCLDARDTVFSLIGIARVKATHQPQYMLPTPDYTATVGDVFHQTALYILESSENLLLLAYAEGRRFRNIDEIPSWVPDWTTRKALGLAYTGYKSFQADGQRLRYAELRFEQRVLAIEVAMVDTVSMIGETKESVLRTGRFPQWLAIIASLAPETASGQTRKEIFWRTLLTDVVPDHNGLQYPAPAEFEQLFDSWLLSLLHTERCLEYSSEAVKDSMFEHAMEHEIQWLCDLATKEEESDMASTRAARFRTVYSNALHIRLFRTAKGYLGIGSESIEEGDAVCIASGSRVPLVLRSRQRANVDRSCGTSRYELVGAAYVHNCMHGEVLRPPGTEFHIIEVD